MNEPKKNESGEPKHYLVDVVAISTVLVMNAKNSDEAFDFAATELSKGDFDIDDMSIYATIEPGDEVAVEKARRLAHAVSENE